MSFPNEEPFESVNENQTNEAQTNFDFVQENNNNFIPMTDDNNNSMNSTKYFSDEKFKDTIKKNSCRLRQKNSVQINGFIINQLKKFSINIKFNYL